MANKFSLPVSKGSKGSKVSKVSKVSKIFKSIEVFNASTISEPSGVKENLSTSRFSSRFRSVLAS